MAVMGSLSRVWGCRLLLMKQAVIPLCAPLRTLSTLSWMPNLTQPPSSLSISSNFLARALPSLGTLMPVRTKKRGMEYQPKFLKRKRTHGWLKRISTRGGIEVILRRMLKGRKSLTH